MMRNSANYDTPTIILLCADPITTKRLEYFYNFSGFNFASTFIFHINQDNSFGAYYLCRPLHIWQTKVVYLRQINFHILIQFFFHEHIWNYLIILYICMNSFSSLMGV